MGRMVEPPRRIRTSHQEGVGGEGDQLTGGDGFLERVVKYVPVEILTAYMTLDRMVASDARSLRKSVKEVTALPLTKSQTLDMYLPEIVFAGMLVMVFVYFRTLAQLSDNPDSRQIWFKQALVSAVVFVVWTYAMRGSVFTLNGLFFDKYAAMMVPFFTLLAGMFRPQPVGDATQLSQGQVMTLSPAPPPRPAETAQTPPAKPPQNSAPVAQDPPQPVIAKKHPLARRL